MDVSFADNVCAFPKMHGSTWLPHPHVKLECVRDFSHFGLFLTVQGPLKGGVKSWTDQRRVRSRRRKLRSVS